MIKGEKGFGGHEGFELVDAIEKTLNLMNHIAPILNHKLAEIYYEAYAETIVFLTKIKGYSHNKTSLLPNKLMP